MLFHEPIFLFAFLPITLLVFWALRQWASQPAIVIFVSSASLFFYGWWNIEFVGLLVISILCNFLLGRQLARKSGTRQIRYLLFFGVATNLGILALFKYLGFFAEIVGAVLDHPLHVGLFELPLGISFFTFLQIAYLVDSSRGLTRETAFAPYFLFVTFFPHLIAGPLVHHSELIPQFRHKLGLAWENLAIGGTIFVVGLFKKLVLADAVSGWSDGIFNAAASGLSPSFLDAWIGVLSFTLLIYFDFSAYSDMAVGLSKMFGIRLPANFNSPYKADSIIEFWRRWHITLSRFLRDYLYIPLGGGRSGSFRRYANLMIVMLLAGLWHGANWRFLAWGGIHGLYLFGNHFWRSSVPWRLAPLFGRALTFLAVMFAWVPFRADSWDAVMRIYKGLFILNGFALPPHYASLFPTHMRDWFVSHGLQFIPLSAYGGGVQLAILAALLVIVWGLPNTQQYFGAFSPVLEAPGLSVVTTRVQWRVNPLTAAATGLVFAWLGLLSLQGKAGEFIYFQF